LNAVTFPIQFYDAMGVLRSIFAHPVPD